MVTSPRAPSRGPSAYRCGLAASAARATWPRRSPFSTSRWAPSQRTPGPGAIVTSVRWPPRGSARAGGRGRQAVLAEHGLTLRAAQQVEEGLGKALLLGGRHHRAGIDHRAIRVLGPTDGLLHAMGPRGRVGGVDEARVDLAARHVVECLAHVLREDQLRLDAIPQTD